MQLPMPNSLILCGALCLVLSLTLLLVLGAALLGVHRVVLCLRHVLGPVVAFGTVVVIVIT